MTLSLSDRAAVLELAAAKSNQTGKPVNEVAKDLISAATEKAAAAQSKGGGQ